MINVDISYDIEEIEEYMDDEKVQEIVEYIVNTDDQVNKKDEFYVSILITTNDIIRGINKEYRGKDAYTDVISFAYNETENIGALNVLGDIIISIDKVKEQAMDYGHSVEREFYYVLSHGMLHLLGFDHIEEEDKKIMRKREEEILLNFKYSREV